MKKGDHVDRQELAELARLAHYIGDRLERYIRNSSLEDWQRAVEMPIVQSYAIAIKAVIDRLTKLT